SVEYTKLYSIEYRVYSKYVSRISYIVSRILVIQLGQRLVGQL
ncbi:unnamed protein product, partial [marine sediment metagenome]